MPDKNNSKEGDKKMKSKTCIYLCILFLMIMFTVLPSHAVVVQIGDYRFLFDAYDIFDDPVPDINPQWGPIKFPGWTGSGTTWGIADLQSIQKSVGGVWQTYWTRGVDGKYYEAVIGGLTLTPDPASPIGFREISGHTPHPPDVIPLVEYVGAPPKPYPHNAYMTGTALSPLGFLKLFEHASDDWVQAVSEGPNIAGQGALGTFGKTIIYGPDKTPGTADDPTMVVDAVLNPSALSASGDMDAAFPGSPSGILPSLFRSTSNTATEVKILGWVDVIGGIWQPLIDTNTLFGGSDIRISADVYYLYDASSGKWSVVSGWPS